jgi:hypothetical protein
MVPKGRAILAERSLRLYLVKVTMSKNSVRVALLLATAACAGRSAASRPAPSDAAEGDAAALACAVGAVGRYGLVVTDRPPGRRTFEARSQTESPTSATDPLNGQPVDRLTVRANGARLEARAVTMVPRYADTNGDHAVVWTELPTSVRARNAEREIPAGCSTAGT